MAKKFKYEAISPPNGEAHYRISDEDDDRIATCFQESHAVLVTQFMNTGLGAVRMRRALQRITETQGCECDDYHGHTCLMCRVRQIAREGLNDT